MDKPIARDAQADLALCATATPGKWWMEEAHPGDAMEHGFIVIAAKGIEDIHICGVREDGIAISPQTARILMSVALLPHTSEMPSPRQRADAAFIVEARDGWEWYIERHKRLLTFIADFERKTEAVALGEEDQSGKGASVYNWRSSFLRELKAAISGRREEAQGDALA